MTFILGLIFNKSWTNLSLSLGDISNGAAHFEVPLSNLIATRVKDMADAAIILLTFLTSLILSMGYHRQLTSDLTPNSSFFIT